MNAKDITKIMLRHLVGEKKAKTVVTNAYIFSHWESDVLALKGSGYTVEYEIKISRSDYRADFVNKPTKHNILQTGFVESFDIKREAHRPNRFYYVVPEGLVKKEELPPYAGLIYISESGMVREQVAAPKIHGDKHDVLQKMNTALFWKWYNMQFK